MITSALKFSQPPLLVLLLPVFYSQGVTGELGAKGFHYCLFFFTMSHGQVASRHKLTPRSGSDPMNLFIIIIIIFKVIELTYFTMPKKRIVFSSPKEFAPSVRDTP